MNIIKITCIFISLLFLNIWGCMQNQESNPSDAEPGDNLEKILESSIHLISILDDEQKATILLPFNSEERYPFNYIPMERKGLNIKDMTSEQRIATHNVLQASLSSQGYLKVTGIMRLEDILHELENGDLGFERDPELYYMTFFGQPSKQEPWGWRFEGHHMSLNFTSAANNGFSFTPAFLGSNPAEVRSGPYTGLRVLAMEEDLGRTLVNSFSASQLSKAVIMDEAPRDIVTGTDREVLLEEIAGLPASDMTELQRKLLWQVVKEYANNLKPETASVQLQRIKAAGIDSLHFGWAGGLNRGEPHYYRIHGPTVLFEYDNVQNDANHIHTVWRDIENDFGKDLLRQHYDTAPQEHGHEH
ncbi:MAG: DUF3500 domain-containing protein [Balneolaceae bacterium]